MSDAYTPSGRGRSIRRRAASLLIGAGIVAAVAALLAASPAHAGSTVDHGAPWTAACKDKLDVLHVWAPLPRRSQTGDA